MRRLHLTPAASPLVRRIWLIADRARAEALEGMAMDEREQLLALLRRLHDNLVGLVPGSLDVERARRWRPAQRHAASAKNYYAVGPSVRYALDYTGGLQRGVEQQQALAEVQAQQLQATYLALTGNIARQVLAIAAVRAQIAAVETLLEQDRRNVALVQTAFAAGSVSRVDVLAAQSQLANDQTRLPPLRQQLGIAQHALAVLVGRTPTGWTAPDFERSALKLPQQLPLTLPSELAHRRPDILAAEARLHAATAAVGVAAAQRY